MRETEITEITMSKVFRDVKSILTKSREKEPIILSVFNNKGGVGKTTLSYFLSRTLSNKYKKKVLVMDFDPLQGDLTRLIGLPAEEYLPLIEWITLKKKDLLAKIKESGKKGIFQKTSNLHCVYADTDENYKQYTKQSASITKIRDYSKKIRNVLKTGFEEHSSYDFVIIDTPPGWWFYSMLANAISDMVIIPISTTSVSSWRNAIRYLKNYLPDLKEDLNNRIENGPQPLPFLYNQNIVGGQYKNKKLYKYLTAHNFLEKEVENIGTKEVSKILRSLVFNYKESASGAKNPSHPTMNFDLSIQSADLEDKNEKDQLKKLDGQLSAICEFYFPELRMWKEKE